MYICDGGLEEVRIGEIFFNWWEIISGLEMWNQFIIDTHEMWNHFIIDTQERPLPAILHHPNPKTSPLGSKHGGTLEKHMPHSYANE